MLMCAFTFPQNTHERDDTVPGQIGQPACIPLANPWALEPETLALHKGKI
jgi:hypothetical protein